MLKKKIIAEAYRCILGLCSALLHPVRHLFLLPLVLSIAFSFTNYDGWKVMDFVGIKNYITLFKGFQILRVHGPHAGVHHLLPAPSA